jgi:hypothetical protein
MVPDTMQHWPTSKTNRVHEKCNMTIHKAEVVITTLQSIETRFQTTK